MTRPVSRHRRPARAAAIVLAGAWCSFAGVAGCSGDGPKPAAEALAELGITDTPETLMAIAIERPRESLVLPADVGKALLRVQYAVRGMSWADADCAADAVETAIGAEVFASLEMGELQKIEVTNPKVVDIVRTCASPESLMRLDAEVPKDATSAPNPAPDIDAVAVADMFRSLFTASGRSMGFADAEVTCAVDQLVGSRDPATFVKIATGAERLRPEDTSDEVVGCLGDGRLDELAPKIGEKVLADRKAAQEEHDRKQAEIDAAIDEYNKTSTTVAG